MRELFSAVLLLGTSACAAGNISTPVTAFTGDAPTVELYGAVELARKAGDTQINGLSALAWDKDENILYALSDRAHLHHLRPAFADGRLVEVTLLDSYQLRDKDGVKLKGRKRDSEGMHVINADNGQKGDSELLIAFEQHPRIVRFSTSGRHLEKITLPPVLGRRKHYSSPNHALEAVTWHPDLGVLTLPQRPLDEGHFLYSADGRRWPYEMTSLLGNEVVSMETMPDGSLLVMERAFQTGLFFRIRVVFRKVLFDNDELSLSTLAVLDTADGWRLDNFEGLSHHEEGRFFIVSDNNDKAYQRNLLYYFAFE